MREALRSKLLFLRMMKMVMIVMVAVAMRAGGVAGSRISEDLLESLLEENAIKARGQFDSALELTTEAFNSSLWAAPAPWTVVEFYAHWCPACQNFKPHYARVAQLFNGPDAVYPGVLLLAKVDCAEETNRDLCQRFSVKHYPTMLWGEPATFARGSRLQEKDETFQLIDTKANAQSLLDWINTRLKRSYSLQPVGQEKQSGQEGQRLVSLHDIEEATAEAYDIILNDKLVSSSERVPFVQFLQLLAVHHPSKRCRAGSAQILFNLMDAWPSEHILEVDERETNEGSETHSVLANVASLKQHPICGEDLPSKTYKTCSMAPSGYSCGLWYLFHALSVRVDNSETNSAMRAIRNFVANFFTCEECRQHFLKMTESAIESVYSRRNLTLWLWRAHNEVNYRLANDAAVSAELRSSKVQWPTKEVCAACRSSQNAHGSGDEKIEWDEEEVYKFLRKTYGQSILTTAHEEQSLGSKGHGGSNGKDENLTSSAMTAPVGAALCLALASCGFGVAACCWRLQQKKRNSNSGFYRRGRQMRKQF